MYDRNWATPISLTRQAPVSQAKLGHTVADTIRFAKIHSGIDGIFAGLVWRTRKAFDVCDFLRLQRNKGFGQFRISIGIRQERRNNWKTVFGRKLKVARVMRRAAKHSTGAVIHQDKVGDIDGQFPAGIKWMTDG